MWLKLCLIIVLNSVDTKLRGFEIKIKDRTGLFRTIKNPGLPYMARYTWKQKDTPKVLKPPKTGNDHLRRGDTTIDLWEVPTTEVSVSLANVFSTQKYDHVSDYIEYLTRVKGNKNSILRLHDGQKLTKPSVKNISSFFIPTTSKKSTLKKLTNYNYITSYSQYIAVDLADKKAGRRVGRKSDDYNVVDGGIDNAIDSTNQTKKVNEEAIQGDKDLIENQINVIESDSNLNESEKHKANNKTLRENANYKLIGVNQNESHNIKNIDKNCSQKINENFNESIKIVERGHKILDDYYKLQKESNKFIKLSDKKLNDSYTEIEKSDRYLKETDKDLIHSDKYLKEIDKSIKEIATDLKENVKKKEKKLVTLNNIFSGDTIARLLALHAQRNKQHFSEDITASTFRDANALRSLTESRTCGTKKYDKAVKFVIPKSELYNADAVFIVFRNLTGKNLSTSNDNYHDYNNNKRLAQVKFKKSEGTLFKPERRRKITKLLLDGEFPDWLGSKIKQFKNKVSKLNDVQKMFVTKTNLPMHRHKRSIRHAHKQNNTSERKQNISTVADKIRTLKMPDRKINIDVLPMRQSSDKTNKTRATRSSLFGRKYRSPNKFRIMVRPVKRENKLGQIGVHIYREFDPLRDESNHLKKYYDILSPSPQYDNDIWQSENMDSEPSAQPSDTDLGDLEEIDRYLGLNTKSIENTYKNTNNNHTPLNPRKSCKSDPLLNKIDCDVYKTERPKVKSDQNKRSDLNSITNTSIPFSNAKFSDDDYDDTQSIDPLTKQLSMLFPRPRRLARDSRDISEIPDRNSILIFTKKLLKNNKSLRRNSYLSPHIDQQTYVDYMNNDILTTLRSKTDNKLYKTANESIEKQVNIKKIGHIHQNNNNGTNRKAGFKSKENDKQVKQNSRNHTDKLRSLHIPQKYINRNKIFGFLKPYLQSRQQIGPVKNIHKNASNTTVKKIENKSKANISSHNKTNIFYVKPKKNVSLNQVKEHSNKIQNSILKVQDFYSHGANWNNNRNRSPDSYEEDVKTQMSEIIKRSKKRELGSSGVFGEFLGELNDDHNREEMFNVDIGNVGQADVFEQLESTDEYDPEQYAHEANNTNTLLHKYNEQLNLNNKNRQLKANAGRLDIKDAMWIKQSKQTKKDKKVERPNRKLNKVKTTMNSLDISNNIHLYGYENLKTARKLYTDLDPVHSDDNTITHFEKERGIKHNRGIPSMHLHPQLDDYNDEFLRDTNVEPNRIGVDYINYNYLGPGQDFPDYSQTKFDKYANFLAEFHGLGEKITNVTESWKEKDTKPPNKETPTVHKWQKDDYYSELFKLRKPEIIKQTNIVEKPKRLKNFDRNFDYMILDDTGPNVIKDNLSSASKSHKLSTTLPTRLPKPVEVINQFYNQKERRKQLLSKSNSNSTKYNLRNEKRKKKNQTLSKVHIHVETTTEFIPKEVSMKDMNVYIHRQKPLRKKNNLHNSKHLLGMWSKNHEMSKGNSVVVGVSPLDIWTHKSLHQLRPTPISQETYQPDEEEFDRRKRGVEVRRSRLVCCVVKRPDQQELVKHVKATWGRRCDIIVFITSKGTEKQIIWEYTKAGLRFVYELHYKDADWILKADIDSYIVVENLRYMVKEYDPETPLYFGRLGLSDFSNFVLSKEALQNLITRSQDSESCQGSTDEGIGYCLEYLGIKAVDSRDKLGRARFYPFSPFDFNPDFKHTPDEGLDTWSDYAVAFAKVNFKDMYTLDYFLYKIQPLSTTKEILHKVNNITFTEVEETTNTRPPHSQLRLTENNINHRKYDEKNNHSKRLGVNEFQNNMRQLNGLF